MYEIEQGKCDCCGKTGKVIKFNVSYEGSGWAGICFACVKAAQQVNQAELLPDEAHETLEEEKQRKFHATPPW